MVKQIEGIELLLICLEPIDLPPELTQTSLTPFSQILGVTDSQPLIILPQFDMEPFGLTLIFSGWHYPMVRLYSSLSVLTKICSVTGQDHIGVTNKMGIYKRRCDSNFLCNNVEV